jgi:predicted nucleic acid-binding protein
MNHYVLDTTVLIELSKRRESAIPLVTELAKDGILALCPINITEFYAGVEPGDHPEMDAFIEQLHLLPISRSVAHQAGAYRRAFRKRGLVLSTTDTLIAAAAASEFATVVTGNPKHFPMTDVRVLATLRQD